ncbi:MAG: hypothetical protein ACOCWI_00050 [Bacillota bacterium]
MKKFLQVLLHLAGFPLLIALVVLESYNVIETGISYGVMVFVGVIVTVVMAIIYYLVFGIMAKRKKKTIYKQTIVSILVAFICLGGLWVAVDVALPDFLDDATSGTIFYEDLADDFNSRADINKELLDEYIRRNHANGNLREQSLEQYLQDGAQNEEVMELLKQHFESIDKDGYVTFVGPWIDMANDERLTIPALVHLVINQRDTEGVPFPQTEEEGDETVMLDDPVLWSVLDMLGEPMEFDLGPEGMNVIPENLIGTLTLIQATINDMLESVSTAVEDEAILGSPVYIKLNDGTVLTLTPSNEFRGVLDYQSMAWLDSNGLIYAITAFFAVRKLFLIFAGVLMITTFAIGLLRDSDAEKTYKKEASEKKEDNFQHSILDRNDLSLEHYKPYDPSYVVITQGVNRLDFDKINSQLLEDSQNKVTKRYSEKDFLSK